MVFSFNSITLRDINDEVLVNTNLYKTIGNVIYKGTRDLGMLEIAREIYAGKDVNLADDEVAEVERVVSDPGSGVVAFARQAVLEYITKVKKSKLKG
jgi:hypothetical protein